MNSFPKVIALCAIAFVSYSANAQNPLRLQDAIQLTLKNNPQLAGYEFRAQALQGELQTAELKPQLRASAHLENIAGSGEFKGVDAAELTLSLSSVIELGDQRAARTGLVTARQQQLQSSQRLLTLDTLTQVTQQFIALAAAQEELKLLQQHQQLAQANVNSLTQQVQAGRTAEADLLRAKAALVRADIAIQKNRQAFQAERIKLSAFWADTSPAFTQVQADLFALAELPRIDNLIQQLDSNPDLAVLGDEVVLRKAQVRQAQAERSTNLEWSAGVRRLQLSDDSALVMGLSMPLGSAQRARGAIATARAEQSGVEQEQSATRIKLQAQLISLHSAYQQALNEVNSLRTQVIPALQQATRSTANAFNQGRYSYLELNFAQRELLDVQIALIESAAHAQLIHNEIERIIGSALSKNTAVNSLPQGTQP